MTDRLVNLLQQLDIIYLYPVQLKNAGSSNFYVDVKKAFGEPDILNIIADEMHARFKPDVTCIAASGFGGVPLAAAISSRYGLHLIQIRDEPKKYGKMGLIEGYVPIASDKIAIIDDVFSTGGSIRQIIDALSPTGAQIVGAYVVAKRGEGALPVPLTYLVTAEQLIAGRLH